MKVIVTHAFYGCDTGCCGHAIEIDDRRVDFSFSHFNLEEDKQELIDWVRKELTRELGPNHVADIDWENSIIVDFQDCKWS